MISHFFLLLLINIVASENCYWNAECPYQLFSSKTPYDTIRGDIRDFANLQNCQATNIWSLHRHGNRNPGSSVTESVKEIAALKDIIITSHEAGTSKLCSQDIEVLRKWTWNETLEISQSFLTGTGYEELYDIAKRLRQKYPHLLEGTEDSYYFRPTNEQRTITSSMAFVHGLTDNNNLNLSIDGPWERDDVIRPYENCERYQTQVKSAQILNDNIADYLSSTEYVAVQNRVQERLGISYQFTAEDIYSLYELCRFDRSWSVTKQSPWCAAFTDEDLVVLEYRDDVRHYYRNAYGSWVNVNLGGPVLRDLYEKFEAAVQGRGKTITSYFTHDTMMEMTFCALDLYKEDSAILGSKRNNNRVWRTSNFAAFSTNIIAVLNSCSESGNKINRVQLFINEKETDICPSEGCTWQQFQDIFQKFQNSTLDFCSLDYPEPDSAAITTGMIGWIMFMQFVLYLGSIENSFF